MTIHDMIVTRWGTHFMGRRLPSVIGRGGIVPPEDKREGDGATPAGEHRIVGMLYRPDRITDSTTLAKGSAESPRYSGSAAPKIPWVNSSIIGSSDSGTP